MSDIDGTIREAEGKRFEAQQRLIRYRLGFSGQTEFDDQILALCQAHIEILDNQIQVFGQIKRGPSRVLHEKRPSDGRWPRVGRP